VKRKHAEVLPLAGRPLVLITVLQQIYEAPTTTLPWFRNG
jgi:hypothetical protein